METGYSMKISNSKCRLGIHCCVLALLNVGFPVLLRLTVIRAIYASENKPRLK